MTLTRIVYFSIKLRNCILLGVMPFQCFRAFVAEKNGRRNYLIEDFEKM